MVFYGAHEVVTDLLIKTSRHQPVSGPPTLGGYLPTPTGDQGANSIVKQRGVTTGQVSRFFQALKISGKQNGYKIKIYLFL